ncbi:MAG: RIP metalloprotease RseP [Gammaproteobacteria bacterium]|nr:RIP metalloprotease RseP [Gammaproteobacteria bacterium]
MDFLYSVIGFLIAIGVLVAVHEFGHFWVARKLGVKVLRYSIGFGKPLWRKVSGEDQIEYVIAAIPLGGYVKMLGEGSAADPVAPHERHRAFDNQPIWKRTLIVAAGPGINFLFAIVLFWILGMAPKEALVPVLGEVPVESALAAEGVQAGATIVSVDGKPVEFFGQHDLYIFNQVLKGDDIALQLESISGQRRDIVLPVDDIPIYNINPRLVTWSLGLVPLRPPITPILNQVVAGSPAELSGLQSGDRIVAIDGRPVSTWSDLVELVSAAPNRSLNLRVEREQRIISLTATPEAVERENGEAGRLGISPVVEPYPDADIVASQRGPLQAVGYGIEQTWLMSSVTLRMLWKMVTLQVSHTNISGPITIAEVSGQALQIGWDYYLYILAVISISLGVMNLLPIPMLDGGHLLMYAVELIAGPNAAEKAFAVGQQLGVLLLVCLMSLAFYNDIFRLLN